MPIPATAAATAPSLPSMLSRPFGKKEGVSRKNRSGDECRQLKCHGTLSLFGAAVG
jgi:hypothetical protein